MIYSQGITADNLVLSGKKVHFIGIGGISMSSIAIMAHRAGAVVTGCDLAENDGTCACRAEGIAVVHGHSPSHVIDSDLVVYSSAVPQHNLEMVAARENGALIIPRALMLARLLREKESIGVAGSHGKTTTTYILSQMFLDQNYDPAVMVGGRINEWHAAFTIGKGKYFISEVDESDGSLLCLNQNNSLITNIDLDHVDFYRDITHLKEVFRQYAENTNGGILVACGDDENLRSALDGIQKEVVWYGLGTNNDAYPVDIVSLGLGRSFRLIVKGSDAGEYICPLLGEHNLLNCVGALTVAILHGLDPKKLAATTAMLRGVIRRQDSLGEISGIKVVDDYAHHPTEIRATINALRELKPKRLIVVFQPHRFSRTAALAKELAQSLTAADFVVVSDIYPANEQPITGVTSLLVVRELERIGFANAQYIGRMDLIYNYLRTKCSPGDLLVTMGAGDIRNLGVKFVEKSFR